MPLTFAAAASFSATNNAANFGQAASFDGTSSVSATPVLAATASSSYTMEARVRTTASVLSVISALHGGSGTLAAWFGILASGHAAFSHPGYQSGGIADSGVVINDGNWHSLALVVSGGATGYYFVDGVLTNTVSLTATAIPSPILVLADLGDPTSHYYLAGQIDEASLSSTAQYTASYTPATNPFSDGRTGQVDVYHLDGNLNDTAVVGAVIAPNDPGILYSPYTWLVTASAAKTINAGAYIRTLIISTTTCKIPLTVGAATPYSEVYARLDGGAWQEYIPTAGGAQAWTLAMPTGTSATKHLLEIVVKSTTETQDRWNTQATAVQIGGLILDSGGSVSLPSKRKYTAIIYGDSITEGVRVYGATAANDTDRNDATVDYSYRLGEMLDAEIGVVGFGATGLTVAGSGNVPALPQSYNFLWSGQSRTFTPVPDLVIYNEGTNDSRASASASAISSALTGVISGIGYASTQATAAGLAGTRHLVLEPFGAYFASALQAAANAIASANVVYGDTTGLFNVAGSSDGLHPYAYVHLSSLAPGVAALAMPLLHPAGSAQPAPSPAAVALAITITHNNLGQPVITWVADPLATGYKVLRSVDGAAYTEIAPVAVGTLTYTDTARPNVATVDYAVVSTH